MQVYMLFYFSSSLIHIFEQCQQPALNVALFVVRGFAIGSVSTKMLMIENFWFFTYLFIFLQGCSFAFDVMNQTIIMSSWRPPGDKGTRSF